MNRFSPSSRPPGWWIIPGFLSLLLFFSCGGKEDRVGLASYNLNDPYIYTFAEQIEEFSQNQFRLTSRNAQNSQMLQNEQIEEMIAEGVNLLIINPVDRLGSYPIIRQLKNRNIPVIFFNREPLLEDLMLWDKAFYVGARAEQSGQLQAALVMELFGDNPDALNRFDRNGDNRIQAVILKGEQGHQDAEIRTAEVVRAFENRRFNLDILVTEVANWNELQAYEKMDPILNRFGREIEVILSNNDAMALGAISRLREHNWFIDTNGNGRIDAEDEGWIPVVGIDGLDRAVEQIEKGFLYGTVLNDSREQAKAIVDLARLLLEGEEPDRLDYPMEGEKYIWIDYQVFLLNR